MYRDLKGFAKFISIERGLMLFLVTIGATFLTVESLAWSNAIFLGLIVFCVWSGVDAINNVFDVDLDALSDPSRAEYTRKLGKIGLFVATVFSALSFGFRRYYNESIRNLVHNDRHPLWRAILCSAF